MGITDVTKQLTFHRHFLPEWERNATRPCITQGDRTSTFEQHHDRVSRLATALGSELGVRRDSRFGVLALNSPDYLEAYHAAYLGGGIINPINTRLAAKEVEFILQDSGTEVLLVDQSFAEMIDQVRPNLPELRSVVLIGDGDVPHDLRYEDLLSAGSTTPPVEGDEDDSISLMYTGGTTGLPKGVVHTQRSQTLTLNMVASILPYDPDRARYLTATPMFHAASFPAILTCPFLGVHQVMMQAFEPGAALALIKEHGLTDSFMVPVMILMMLDHPSFDPGSLSHFESMMYGGSPMPLATQHRFQEQLPGSKLIQGYGMTEGLPLTLLDDETHRRGGKPLQSAGKPCRGVIVTVQDDEGNVLPTGEIGEVCARTGIYMSGYWNRPDETEAAFRGGWYHSGDVGYFDGEGYLFLVDRAKDMIVSGGENVYSSEVESAISTHPAVAQVAVIGIPDDKWGEAVHAVVVRRPGTDPTEGEIIAHARESIAGYKLPRSVSFQDDPLPLSGANKTLKRALRAPYWEGIDRNVN